MHAMGGLGERGKNGLTAGEAEAIGGCGRGGEGAEKCVFAPAFSDDEKFEHAFLLAALGVDARRASGARGGLEGI